MNRSAEETRRIFSVWLRTGRVPQARTDEDAVEVKFNPWHDPRNGRFTFAGQGRHYGARGSGGSFGGGGATSREPWPSHRATPKASPAKPAVRQSPPRTRDVDLPNIREVGRPEAVKKPVSPAVPQARSAPRRAASQLGQQFRRIVRSGYEYQIDSEDRTRRVSGELTTSSSQVRSRTVQRRAGGVDRRPSDDGGHYVAARFNGPTEAFNHVAQDANFNRGRYRRVEEEWAQAKQAGKSVFVKIAPVYRENSSRPYLINVWYLIDGVERSQRFLNERQEKHRAE